MKVKGNLFLIFAALFVLYKGWDGSYIGIKDTIIGLTFIVLHYLDLMYELLKQINKKLSEEK